MFLEVRIVVDKVHLNFALNANGNATLTLRGMLCDNVMKDDDTNPVRTTIVKWIWHIEWQYPITDCDNEGQLSVEKYTRQNIDV